MKDKIFKKEDKVFDIRRGWGIVSQIGINFIEVEFKNQKGNNLVVWYENNDSIIFLSFTEYYLEGFSQERPEDLPELGDVVWVRDKDSDGWEVSHFYKKDYLGYHACSDSKLYNVVIWSQLRKTNPYKNEE